MIPEMILNTYIMVKKIQIDDFKRIFSKKHVQKRSWIVSGGYLWDVSIGKNDCGC